MTVRLPSIPARLLAVALLAALLLTGCDRPPEEVTEEETVFPPVAVRIVSLAPALTQMLNDLGEGKAIVGVAQNDDLAAPDTPSVGNYQDIDSEAIIKLHPTVVVMMTGKDGVPSQISDLAQKEKFDLLTFPSPTNTTDVANILYHEEIEGATQPAQPSLGYFFGISESAQSLKYKLLGDLVRLSDLTAKIEPKPRVLALISTTELGASGPHTILDELIDKAGGVNVLEDERVGYVTLDREMVLKLKPDVILIVAPGAPPLEPIDKDSRLANLRGLDVPAVVKGRIQLINDPTALLPSSTLGKIAVLVAKAVHPELAEKIDRTLAAPPDLGPSNETPHDAASQPATKPAR